MKELILSTNLTHEHKVTLLKIKLDHIINGCCGGKSRFLITALLGVILTFTISGVDGLSLILEALYRFFKERKISKVISKRWFRTPLPIKHLNS